MCPAQLFVVHIPHLFSSMSNVNILPVINLTMSSVFTHRQANVEILSEHLTNGMILMLLLMV